MAQDSTKPRKGIWDLIFLFIVLGAMAAGILWMVAATAKPVESKARATPTVACETIAEGILRCPDGLRTAVARPADSAPRRATPQPKR